MSKYDLHVNTAVANHEKGELEARVNATDLKSIDVQMVNELLTCRGLYALNLSRVELSDEVLQKIARLPDLRQLQILRCDLTPEQLAFLAHHSKLELLDIGNCQRISASDIRAIDFQESDLRALYAEGIVTEDFSSAKVKVYSNGIDPRLLGSRRLLNGESPMADDM